MRRNLTIIVVCALAVAVGAWRLQQIRTVKPEQPQAMSPYHGAMFEPVVAAPNITLTNHHEQPFQLHDQKGNAVVLFFGFTSCPDVCPATLAHFKQVKRHLGDDADHVKFIMVSVDPERDTPERMAQYIEAFDPDFIGLTGSMEEAQAAWNVYDVRPRKVELPDSALGYTVEHPASAYVIDAQGNLRLMHFFGMPADAVAEDIQRILRS